LLPEKVQVEVCGKNMNMDLRENDEFLLSLIYGITALVH